MKLTFFTRQVDLNVLTLRVLEDEWCRHELVRLRKPERLLSFLPVGWDLLKNKNIFCLSLGNCASFKVDMLLFTAIIWVNVLIRKQIEENWSRQ